jgi:hypothetical protein
VSGAQHKTFRLGQRKGAAAPSAEQLAAINAFTLRDFTADELHVRTFVLCHNCVDRDNECFDEALLQDFAKSLPGKGVFVKHPTGWDGDSGPGEGLVFATQVETMSLEEAQALMRGQPLQLPPDRTQVSLVLADTYFPKTAENAALLTKLDAGVACFVSVGFSASARQQVSDAAGNEYELRRWVGPGEAHEMSLVWLGAQPGARAVKSAPRNNEANDMNLQEQLDAEKAKNAELTAALEAAKSAGNAPLDALKTALGDSAALADDPAGLAALALAGGAHKAALIDDIVKADRLAGALGDQPEAVEAARKEYGAMPLAALKRLHIVAAKALAQAGTPSVAGGDPNPEVPAPAGGKKTAFDNPVFQH